MPVNLFLIRARTRLGALATGGQEKDRFTVQLSITKAGRKLTHFLIVKGEYLLIGLFVLREILHLII